jgi:hypothetical protein
MTPQERLAKCEQYLRDNIQYFRADCSCLDCSFVRRASGEAELIRGEIGLVPRADLPRSEDAVRSAETLKELQILELSYSRDVTDMSTAWSMRNSYNLNAVNPYDNPYPDPNRNWP